MITTDAELKAAIAACHAYLNPTSTPPQTGIRIAMLGDSHIAVPDWTQLLGRTDVSNHGISGDTAANILANPSRLQAVYDDAPEVCFYMVGKNDIDAGISAGGIATSVRDIGVRLLDHRIEPIFLIPFYVSLTYQGAGYINSMVNGIHSLSYQKCQDAGITWLNDLDQLCVDNALQPQYTSDGCHLNASGQAIWAQCIKNAIAALGV